uniref:Doublecortin domain-containing protein n=1 Tax=Parastrongyloides trichosuri TaxID=131310 RepID=A0A0N5A188_PARTI
MVREFLDAAMNSGDFILRDVGDAQLLGDNPHVNFTTSEGLAFLEAYNTWVNKSWKPVDRERRQQAVQNRRMVMGETKNLCINHVPPKKTSHRYSKTFVEKRISDHEKEPKLVVKKIVSKKVPMVVPKNVESGTFFPKSEKIHLKMGPNSKKSEVKSILKKNKILNRTLSRTVRFDQSIFNVENVSFHDATNVVYNFNEKKIPPWADKVAITSTFNQSLSLSPINLAFHIYNCD